MIHFVQTFLEEGELGNGFSIRGEGDSGLNDGANIFKRHTTPEHDKNQSVTSKPPIISPAHHKHPVEKVTFTAVNVQCSNSSRINQLTRCLFYVVLHICVIFYAFYR